MSQYIESEKVELKVRLCHNKWLIEWEPHTRDFSHELGDQTSQRI